MAENVIQVVDLSQLTSVVAEDFLHIKRFSDVTDYKIQVVDFAASISTSLSLGTFASINQADRSIIAGNGLTGGGDLTATRTVTLGTPSTITKSTTNSTTATSHTHAMTIEGTVLLGGIIMFEGMFDGKNPIPTGGTVGDPAWHICDGTGGTSNMMDRVPIGSGNLYSTGSTGGNKDAIVVNHTHSATSNVMGAHTHGFGGGRQVELNNSTGSGNAAGAFKGGQNLITISATDSAGSHNHTISVNAQGVSGIDKNLPPYYAVAYIKRIL